LNKLSTLGYLPDGNKKYVETLRKCLEYIKLEHPTQQQIVQWFYDRYGSRSKKGNPSYVRTVKSLKLTEESEGKFSVNQLGEEFLAKRANSIVYQQLDQNYKGISDILKMLVKDPLTMNEIFSFLKKKIEAKWTTSTQCRIRIDWLESLGYLIKDGLKYGLTAAGKSNVERKDEYAEPWEHGEIQDLIFELGHVLGYISEEEFPIGRCKYDVAWKEYEGALAPSHVFEIQKHGNLDKALRKLKYAYMNGVHELFLVIDPKEKSNAECLVKTTFNEIANFIKIRTPQEMKEWCAASAWASEEAKTVGGYKGIKVKRRRGDAVDERKKDSRS